VTVTPKADDDDDDDNDDDARIWQLRQLSLPHEPKQKQKQTRKYTKLRLHRSTRVADQT